MPHLIIAGGSQKSVGRSGLPAATGFYHKAESDETPLTSAANTEIAEEWLVGAAGLAVRAV